GSGLPPKLSDNGAAASSRARRDGWLGRGRRPTPGSRRGAAARDISRDKAPRLRTRPSLRRARWQAPPRAPPARVRLSFPARRPSGGLEKDRKAKRARRRYRPLIGGQAAIRPRHHWHAQSLRGASGFDLVAHEANMRWLRPDEMNVVLGQYFGKAR